MRHNGWDHGLKVTDDGADLGAAPRAPLSGAPSAWSAPRTLARIAQARARIGAHVWKLIEDTPVAAHRREGPSESASCPVKYLGALVTMVEVRCRGKFHKLFP